MVNLPCKLNERNKTMSKIKRILVEDYSALTGQEIEPVNNEPSKVDWAIAEINNALITLEKEGAYGYIVDLKDYKQRIDNVIQKTLRPF
jgi:hypothetical protein